MKKWDLDADALIRAAAMELQSAMESEDPEPHIRNARRCIQLFAEVRE